MMIFFLSFQPLRESLLGNQHKNTKNSSAAKNTPATCTKDCEEHVLKKVARLQIAYEQSSDGNDVEETSIREQPVETRPYHRLHNMPAQRDMLIRRLLCSSPWAVLPNDCVLLAYRAAFVRSLACQQPPLCPPGTARAAVPPRWSASPCPDF